MERGKEREEAWSFDGVSEGKRTAAKGCEENKENLIVNSELKDDLLVYQDEEALNDSVISGEERPEPRAGSRGQGPAPGLEGRRARADQQGRLQTGPGQALGSEVLSEPVSFR